MSSVAALVSTLDKETTASRRLSDQVIAEKDAKIAGLEAQVDDLQEQVRKLKLKIKNKNDPAELM